MYVFTQFKTSGNKKFCPEKFHFIFTWHRQKTKNLSLFSKDLNWVRGNVYRNMLTDLAYAMRPLRLWLSWKWPKHIGITRGKSSEFNWIVHVAIYYIVIDDFSAGKNTGSASGLNFKEDMYTGTRPWQLLQVYRVEIGYCEAFFKGFRSLGFIFKMYNVHDESYPIR